MTRSAAKTATGSSAWIGTIAAVRLLAEGAAGTVRARRSNGETTSRVHAMSP